MTWDDKTEQTKSEAVMKLAIKLSDELNKVHEGVIDLDKSKRNAALALKIQMDLSELLASSEWVAKGLKNNIKIVESTTAANERTNAGKKLTDQAIKELVARNPDVIEAEKNAIEAEKEFKKMSYIFGIMREAHVFFRNLGNGKSEWNV